MVFVIVSRTLKLFVTEIIGVQLSKSGGLVIKNSCHAKAVKKVMGKGINFLEGGPVKVVDLTEKVGESLEHLYQKECIRIKKRECINAIILF